ncbi:DUF2845 domain-containing protein [Geotalea toluenoxydans]|uniref:DUF2845 domain-containing protein n=1 Tax=Geotalea toluenoxydans TaxID=421624 RepID=UPI0006D274EC|nr:DUF2845 domain-containing protein [Geotalea toluenoxydans]
MNKFLFFLAACLLVVGFVEAGFAVESSTCRCTNGIVSTGDAMVEVIAKCGEPTMKTQREEKRLGPDKKDFSIVTIDEWNYNFGPNAFMYAFRFVDGRVERIDSLDYGY